MIKSMQTRSFQARAALFPDEAHDRAPDGRQYDGWEWRQSMGLWWRVCTTCETAFSGVWCRRSAEKLVAEGRLPPHDTSALTERCCDYEFLVASPAMGIADAAPVVD